MLCYRDMTFCSFFRTCKYGDNDCADRALTDGVVARAKAFDLPIAQFVEIPDCYEDNTK